MHNYKITLKSIKSIFLVCITCDYTEAYQFFFERTKTIWAIISKWDSK